MTKIPNFPMHHLLVDTDLQYMMWFLGQNQDKSFLHVLELDWYNFWILTFGNYFHKKTKMTKVPMIHLFAYTNLLCRMSLLHWTQDSTFLHSQELDWYNFYILTSGSYFHRLTKIPNFPIDHLGDTNLLTR